MKHTSHLCYCRMPEFPLQSLPVLPRPLGTKPQATRKGWRHMTKNPKRKTPPHAGAPAEPLTLAEVLAALDRPGGLSGTRLRDLKSSTKRVAILLGNEPAAIPLDMAAISARLAAVNPAALSLTAKRFANVRSDFLAAVKASGVKPLKVELKSTLSPDWVDLFERLSGQRAHIGLSRLARYASAQGLGTQDVAEEDT